MEILSPEGIIRRILNRVRRTPRHGSGILTAEVTQMNITTFKAPPEGFDPVTAPLKTLALHGIPRRPDPQAEPGLRALWDKAFARKPKFIVPEANPALVWKSAPHRVPKQK